MSTDGPPGRWPRALTKGRVTAAAIFGVILLVNLLSASPGLVPVTAPDTVGYLEVAQQILRGEAPYLHARTLGYPLFLVLAELTGSWQRIVWIQAIVGAVAAVALWGILRACIRSPLGAAAAAIGIMAAYDISSWHGIALTESLSMSLVILWAFAHLAHLGVVPVALLSQPAWRWVALGLDVALIMQRPTFFFLPAVWYTVLLVAHFGLRRRLTEVPAALARARPIAVNLAVAVVVVLAWCGMIWLQYGRFEISILTRFARLGNLMALRFASTQACVRHTCSPLVRRGVELASTDTMRIVGPFYVVAQLEREFPGVPRGAILDSLNRVLSPTPRYLVHLRGLRRAEFIFAQRGLYNANGMLFRFWPYRVYSSLSWRLGQRLSDLAVLWGALYLALLYRLRRRADWVRLVLLVLVTYTAGINILAAYEGWDRLMAPVVVPLNTLGLLLVLDLVRNTAARLRPARDVEQAIPSG
jgi:hypothetical protein